MVNPGRGRWLRCPLDGQPGRSPLGARGGGGIGCSAPPGRRARAERRDSGAGGIRRPRRGQAAPTRGYQLPSRGLADAAVDHPRRGSAGCRPSAKCRRRRGGQPQRDRRRPHRQHLRRHWAVRRRDLHLSGRDRRPVRDGSGVWPGGDHRGAPHAGIAAGVPGPAGPPPAGAARGDRSGLRSGRGRGRRLAGAERRCSRPDSPSPRAASGLP